MSWKESGAADVIAAALADGAKWVNRCKSFIDRVATHLYRAAR
jgi:hypothetical protein